MNQKKLRTGTICLALSAALLLTGCGGKGGSDKSGGATSGGGSKSDMSSSASSADKSGQPVDYSKYNAYLDLADEISGEIEPILEVYFSNVSFDPSFTVTGDYAAIKEAVEFYTPNTYLVEKALDYLDEEPAYPEADAALRDLGDSPVKVMEALNHLGSYMRFDEFEEDNLTKAREIHAELWSALQVYDANYEAFLAAFDILASQGEEDSLNQLLEEEEMILYHSLCLIRTSEDILNDVWSQIDAANTGEETVLPEIDMTNLSPLFDSLQTSHDSLTQALGSESEREKVEMFTGRVGDSALELYTSRTNSLYSYMGSLAEALMAGTDYAEALLNASDAIGSMIDSYNNIL